MQYMNVDMFGVMNERITENIVRKFLKEKEFYNHPESIIIIEEQKSSNPRIDKLLQNASKGGMRDGRPDFIISFRNDMHFLIVIECKSDISKHESQNKDKYREYAVDGVLLYSSYLSKEFNVLAIAVSGQNEKELKISQFLQLKGGLEPRETRDKRFLSYDDYKQFLKKNLEPLKPEDLIKKAIEYNKKFHSYSIPEVERCTFISCILTSLQNEAFKNSYFDHRDNRDLIENMLSACGIVLKDNKIEDKRKEVILSEYSKIKNNIVLNSKEIRKKRKKDSIPNTILRDLIEDLKESVLPFIVNHNFDLLGQFYREFIKYAGNNKKTGLVLTPFHITDFFCDLVDLKPDDVVYDCCCGTGGFLISAMKKMIEESGNDGSEHKKIKNERILGIEKKSDMFTHACSNMMMRGDGKSNIYHEDCFNAKINKTIKERKPTVSFLNPPYDGGPDEQLKFVEHSLEMLQKNGRCVAICQMSTAIKQDKRTIESRKTLLKKHTLEAVFSMPNQLFHPVGVGTCILFLTAHVPHPKQREVFFGYFKDDGHILMKHRGRLDNGTWEEKKEEMLDLLMNRKSEKGLSVTQCVNAEDEWCAEAYMETDYSQLKEEDFIKTIKNYIAFQFLNHDSKND